MSAPVCAAVPDGNRMSRCNEGDDGFAPHLGHPAVRLVNPKADAAAIFTCGRDGWMCDRRLSEVLAGNQTSSLRIRWVERSRSALGFHRWIASVRILDSKLPLNTAYHTGTRLIALAPRCRCQIWRTATLHYPSIHHPAGHPGSRRFW